MPARPVKTIEERFLARIDKQGGNPCWLWTGMIDREGHGKISSTTNKYTSYVQVHRLSYQIHIGSIPPNAHIIHTCGVKHCVNPAHLRLENDSIESRFWSKVEKQNGDQCWLWTGALDPNGYGNFTCTENKKFEHAHRYAYVLSFGAIPQGMVVCHKCDVPRCVRPGHLFLGTQKDNMHDMIKKGRNSVLQRYDNIGERHPLAKLNDEDVKRIKQLISAGMSIPEIALLFPQVHKTTLYDIKAGKTWRHIS